MKKIMLLFLIVTIFIPPLSMSVSAQDQTQLIKEYMDKAIEEYRIPGASLAIVKGGELFYEDSWGIQSDGTAVTKDTLFTIGSVSKPLTSLAIMKLLEQQDIQLDDEINQYVPSFNYDKNEFKNDITMRHLLTHTSGISTYEGLKVADLKLRGETAITNAFEKLNYVNLNHEPGEVHQYSAANYLLLGKIIENVTNQTFAEFMKDEIFSILHMNQTAASFETASLLDYQAGFQSWFGKPVKSENLFDDSGVPYGYMASTTNDMTKYIQFLLNGGDLLTDQTMEMYTSPQVQRKKDLYYGLGWRVSTAKDDEYYFHGGETPDSRAELLLNPSKNYGFVLLTNKNNISEVLHTSYMREGLKTIIEDEVMPEVSKSSHQMQWMTLIVTLIIALLCIWNLVHLKRKNIIRTKLWIVVSFVSIILAISLIPILVNAFGVPWHSINYYGSDLAIIIKCLIGILVVNGLLSLVLLFLKGKQKNTMKMSDKKASFR
ncbi:serine hydrolase [Bacillus solimangrovi]|uniref:Beta-lactamase-related domain-containing protein n=1 Tax=Bacillus solimangrovi TaxID=1305675 RepID=A0A1E5LE61_9BACI|nr:serine hydrolase [Bacillus solimangrovi]OEH92344.1 hypothetical protein BFG57_16345 [Bacillus solimangrovi]